MIAKFKPPEIIGINIAKVSNPNSGNCNAIDDRLLTVKNFGDAKLNKITIVTKKTVNPATSLSIKNFNLFSFFFMLPIFFYF